MSIHRASAALERVLAADGLAYDRAHDAASRTDLVRVPFQGTSGRWMVFARVGPDQLVRFHAMSPVDPPGDRRGEALVLVALLNLRLALATFELDPDEGGLRVRSTLDAAALTDAPDAVLDRAVSHAFYAASAALDLWLPALLRVLERGEAPLDAVLRTEAER